MRQKLYLGLGLMVLALLAAGALVISPQVSQARQQAADKQPYAATYRGVVSPVHFDVSPPLRSMQIIPPGLNTKNENEDLDTGKHSPGLAQVADPVVQILKGALAIPTPIVSFDGPPNLCNCSPPDPNGEAGPNHVVVMSNLDFQIFSKTGTSLFGPAANNTLWSGFGGGCQTRNDGDPVVLYDQLADRWMLAQFTAAAPYLNCIALSTTNDPTGSYYRWAFPVGNGNNFGDYEKFGMMPQAYFISTREFAGGSSFVGVGAYAGNRAQMLAGNPNPQVISFLAPPSPAYVVGDGLLPADLDGTTLPPTGSDEYYMGSEDDNGGYGAPSDALTLWKFHTDFATPANSSFTLANTIASAPFNTNFPPCGTARNCVPQPGTTNRIDALTSRQRPIFRLAYRNMGTYESLLTNQSVYAGTGPTEAVLGVRWWEVRSPASSPVIYQQGTYAPGLTDGIDRWMGSAAMNAAGSIALGYSAGSAAVYPSIYYTGRLQGDPLGQMTQGEAAIMNGTGSQTGSQRWGDYTDMTVDPTDDCTFWYVNEYVPTTSSVGWRVRVGSFQFGSCGAATPTPVPPTSTATPVPPTSTATPVPPTSTATSVPASATPAAGSPTPTETACAISFSDVHPTDYFYEPVRYLYCHGVISGYGDNTFRPYNNTTRAQMVKIVVLGFGIPVQTPAGGAYTFHDVPPGAPFFDVIETAAAHNIISGYNCGPGGPGPCDPQNRPYFLPNNTVTRGQLSKIDVIAAGWPQINPSTPTFTDVPQASPFYTVIETAVCHGVVSGYADHTFHPFAEATRGQISKIVYLSILDQPGSCAVTPTR